MNAQIEYLVQRARQLSPSEQLLLISCLAEQLRDIQEDSLKIHQVSTHCSEEIFDLLTALSDDFMANGREQLPLRPKESF